jgi:LacI family transcriptional regulator
MNGDNIIYIKRLIKEEEIMNKFDKRPTIKDVAERAQVSVATVSNVLNDLNGYSEETKKKVMDAVAEMKYQRNAIARNLKIKKTHTIGVLLPRVNNTVYFEILHGIEDFAHKHDYSVVICNTGPSSSLTLYYLNVLMESQVDGIIVCSLSPKHQYEKDIVNSNIPCVLVSTFSQNFALPYIKVDDFKAAYAATNYLIENGHKEIAMIAGSSDDPVAGVPRLEGYIQALKDNNIEINHNIIKKSNFSFEEGKYFMEMLLNEKEKFTALFAACDDLAAGAISTANERGLSIPKDLSIIGYDNTRISEMCYPPLTTIAQPFYEMGQKSVELLFKIISTGKNTESLVMNFELIERKSVRNIL